VTVCWWAPRVICGRRNSLHWISLPPLLVRLFTTRQRAAIFEVYLKVLPEFPERVC